MKTSNIIICVLIFVIIAMAVGYSSFASQLTVEGTAEIIGEWNVKIIGIEAKFVSEGVDSGTPQFTNTSATFNAKLVKPGDKVSYVVTIKNSGTIDAKLSSIKFEEDTKDAPEIIYSYINPLETLNAGETTTLEVDILYDSETKQVPQTKVKSITGIIEYVQK